MKLHTNSRNEIEESGWKGIDVIMDLLNENLIKFALLADVDPNEIRRYIDAELETIIKNTWRAKNVSMHELRADVRLP